MLLSTSGRKIQARTWRLGICAFAWISAIATGCADDDAQQEEASSSTDADTKDPDSTTDKTSEQKAESSSADKKADDESGSDTQVGKGDKSDGADSADQSVGNAGGEKSPAKCGDGDKPEQGLQGDVNKGPVNCGLTLLSELPVAGSAQGSGHCAYVRLAGSAPYTGGAIRAFSLADPRNPKQTDEVMSVGGSESMRAHTEEGRAILVSGRGVYDISDCEKMVKKGEIAWPSMNAQSGNFMRALSSHDLAISHNGKRVYSGLGFNIAYIEDLDKPDTWTVKNWSCEMNKQSGFPTNVPNACEGPMHQDVGRQYSHSSDDNLEGTVWFGANQEGSPTQMERSTARMVDISDRESIKILDSVPNFPGHSMNWWRTPKGREYIIGANEGLTRADTCTPYPRPTNLGNALEAYIVEVTGNKFGKPFPLVLDINRPENCDAAKKSGANASISEHSVYNKGGAAFVMLEYGGVGLRIFDLRDGDHPKEVAYYNDGAGHVHSGVFHYDEKRGILIASGRSKAHVLVMQSQVIEALGLPKPTDPDYPYN
jgi:hypothetical protein